MSIRGTLRRFDRLFVPCYIRHLRVDVCIQQRRQSNRSSHADHRSQCEHKTDHNPREVARYNCIYDHKEMLIAKLFEAIDHASREEEDEEVQVHVERWPCCWLMLRDRRDDRDISYENNWSVEERAIGKEMLTFWHSLCPTESRSDQSKEQSTLST